MSSNPNPLTNDERLAEQLLSQTLGDSIRLESGTNLTPEGRRSQVRRCSVLDGLKAAPASIIIKRVSTLPGEPYDPNSPDGPATRLFNEWASLQFLTTLASSESLVPQFLGGDREAGLIVMEDLGEGESLVEPLMGTDRKRAERALEAYFCSLGHLNALSMGHEDSYWTIRDALGPRDPFGQMALDAATNMLYQHLKQVCEQVGLEIPQALQADLVQAAAFKAEPGYFLAFTQHDACPDNCLWAGEQMRFFDFEWGGFRHALGDGVRAWSNFPTCWCVNRLPVEIIRHTLAIYRQELVKACPAARDDTLWGQEVVKACAYWTLFSIASYGDLWQEDRTWGRSTMRQRMVIRFELLAQVAAEYEHLEALGEFAQTLVLKLQQLWPELEPMPYYPAFS